YRRWNFEPERLRSLEIDHQIVLGRVLHRQVGGLLALEDAIDVAGRAAVLVEEIQPICDETAGHSVKAGTVNCRQPVLRRQRDDQVAMRRGSRRHTWRDLLEQFQPFSGDGIFEDSKAGGVAAWPREVLDIAGGDPGRRYPRIRSARCGSLPATLRWRRLWRPE